MLPDIDSLALFVRAAELRSLTKAAEASHIGLAAASRRIAMLEHRFHTTLLERSSRGVEMTAAGASLLPHARALLVELNQMQAEMRDHAHGRKGALRILANTSVITDTLPIDLSAFAHHNPDVKVIVQERRSEEIVRSLQSAEADVGIVVEGISVEGLEIRPYCQDRLAVVMPHNHALAVFDTLSFNDVLDDELITLEGGSSMTRLLASQAVIAQRTLQLRIQVRSFEAICHMVDAGLGLGLLPEQAARVLAKGLDLAVRPFSDPWAERRMLLCARKDRAAMPSVSKLIDFLCDRGHLPGNDNETKGSAL
ncbi:MAG: LysR family transcriptional regulator [Betaproteobacteria bacterium]|nr:LysR family transcriptional regulator [Betaproteobacteria bacterium]